jgi:short-subunit dehydrogenase
VSRGQGRTGRGGALIVGASGGLGAALARQLAREGYRVALVARRRPELDSLCQELNAGAGVGGAGAAVALAYEHDVRDTDAAPQLFARIADDVAPLRMVIYAAGVMPRVTTGTSFADERDIIEVNVTGALRWLSLAAAHFEGQGAGTIIGLSSVAGDRGRPGNGAYMASKAALSSYLDSLRFRLKPRGVHVLTAKPGYVWTEMTAGLKLAKPLTIMPDRAARGVLQAAARGKSVAYVPGYWGAIMWLVRRLPAAMVARLP